MISKQKELDAKTNELDAVLKKIKVSKVSEVNEVSKGKQEKSEADIKEKKNAHTFFLKVAGEEINAGSTLNRPGVAGAVLHTASLLIHSLNN